MEYLYVPCFFFNLIAVDQNYQINYYYWWGKKPSILLHFYSTFICSKIIRLIIIIDEEKAEYIIALLFNVYLLGDTATNIW